MDQIKDSPAIQPPADDATSDIARVPPRLVLLSASAMWLLYYVLVTLRSLLFNDTSDLGEMLWRRAVVTLAGIAVTTLAWPVIARFDRHSLTVRAIAALVVMLPAALLLALVNQKVFEPIEARQMAKEAAAQAKAGNTGPVTIIHNDGGNMLMDGPAARAEALRIAAEAQRQAAEAQREAAEAAREASERTLAAMREARSAGGQTQAAPAPPAVPAIPAPPVPASTVHVMAPAALPAHVTYDSGEAKWQILTDVVLSRYFLLVAWAALYLALGNAEQARVAERREGQYRRAAKAAELRSLRYQVNPHFLFNTLNSLSALVMVGRADEAERMIQSIARFYRHSLAADPTADLPLADEIALQRHYLDIEAVRFPERLVTEFDIPAGLETACVPGMILQPLVENSIRYAVSPSRHPVTVRISAREAGSLLVLTVADDGAGASAVAGAATPGTGIGLANVRLRLEARFGNGAHLQCGALPAGGYASILTLPLVRNAC
ncbi:histidine kinase [Novosphingobium sp.]|uniref:histidine kinase n=1 Tax=Novosphingobium sp. TaxID=1874826 RepID=UPI0025D4E946|nr:histidine kinase [Novosphingobium sp.]